MGIYSIKHSSKKPFLTETRDDFTESLETYVGGAFTFAQESLKRFFDDHGETPLSEGASKKGVGATVCLGALASTDTMDRPSYLPVHWVRSGVAHSLRHTALVEQASVNWRRRSPAK